MSWMLAQDPVLGDKRSCDALDSIIVPRVRDLGGGFSVRLVLPAGQKKERPPGRIGRRFPAGELSEPSRCK